MLKFLVTIPQASMPALNAVPGIEINNADQASVPTKPVKAAKPPREKSNSELAAEIISPFLQKQRVRVGNDALMQLVKAAYPHWVDGKKGKGDVWRNASYRAVEDMCVAGQVIKIGSGQSSSYMWNRAFAKPISEPGNGDDHYLNSRAGDGPTLKLMREIIGAAGATTETIAEAFAKAGHHSATHNTTRGKMVKAGEIEMIDGIWKFTPKGEEVATTPPPRMNGHAA